MVYLLYENPKWQGLRQRSQPADSIKGGSLLIMTIRLLLIEDSQIDQMAFERFVQQERLDYEYAIASSIAEARHLTRKHTFDLIVLDYLLGDGTAFDLLDEIKETPTIIVTGANDAEIAVKAIKAGSYDYVTKDADGNYLTTLPVTVVKALNRKYAEDELRIYREHLEVLVRERTAELEAEIVERNRAEKALRESEERYRRLVENAPLGIISIDTQGRMMDVNVMLVAMLGSPSAEATREINMLTFPPLVEAGVSGDFQRCLETGEPGIFERPYRSKWHRQVYFRYHLSPLRDADNIIRGVQAIVEDVTERKWAEEALRESEAEYRSLFKNMLSGFAYHKIVVDDEETPIDYIFLEINGAFENLTGLRRNVVGKRASEVIAGLRDLEPDLISIFGDVALSGRKTSFDLYFAPRGSWFSVSAYSPEKGYFVSLLDDITERKWGEESLRELNEELEQRVEARTIELQEANLALQESLGILRKAQEQLVQSEKMASLGGLVAGVAHEINTPVGVGVTAASYLHQRTLGVKQLYEQGNMKRSDLMGYLNTASESTEMILGNLLRAADQVKSFKQVAVDQTNDEKRFFNLKLYLDGVLFSLRPKLKRTKHTITVNCPENLEFESSPGAFSQILTNLVMNSLVHGFEQQEQGQIVLDVSTDKNVLQLHYQDNGCGMTEDVRAKIFEPFYTTKRAQGGTGLGLHIVFNVVTQCLNGNIVCKSAPNQGTSFLITIPLQQASLRE